MSKNALWLSATALFSVVIGVGVAYYFLVPKKPVAKFMLLNTGSVSSVSAPAQVQKRPRRMEIEGNLLMLRASIPRIREALRSAPKDKIDVLKKFLAEQEAALKQAEKDLEEYSKSNPKDAQRVP
jgi:hypothetical protein